MFDDAGRVEKVIFNRSSHLSPESKRVKLEKIVKFK